MIETNAIQLPLSSLTVLILTFNEQDNIERTLQSIHWAEKVLILDSYSDDETLTIAEKFPNVTVLQREFDNFAKQWNFGLDQIETEWTLSIDSDYVFPEGCERDIQEKMATAQDGFRAQFEYYVHGQRVKGSILPGRVVLYRTRKATYDQDGHTQTVVVSGSIGDLSFSIAHDDRKPLARWFNSQMTYAKQEVEKLDSTSYKALHRNDKIRKWIVAAPLLVFVLVYFIRGGFLSGWRGLFYAVQRFYAELLLSIFLLDLKISRLTGTQNDS